MSPELTEEKITLLSPAKVNLHLQVTGKRRDGYHNLKMIMVRVSLFDEINLTLKREGISLSCSGAPLPPPGVDNIAWKAAHDFIEKKKLNTGVHIEIKKRIPIGGGLGGGSSNAAAVLKGLNKLTGNPAGTDELMKIGLKLGADVPFFIFEKPALAEGIGEILHPVSNLPKMGFLLINPGEEISTKSVFENINLRLTKRDKNLNIATFDYDLSKVVSILHNDLEDVTLKRYPEVGKVKDILASSNALGTLMSGSGSTVFGIYKDRQTAEKDALKLKGYIDSRGWSAFAVGSL